MPPAARKTDTHVCPLPFHGTNTIKAPCEPTVLIGYLDAARVGDACDCGAVISKGSPTVLIGNMQAARIGDLTDHKSVINKGEPTVIIGDVGEGERQCMCEAAEAGTATVSALSAAAPDEDSGF